MLLTPENSNGPWLLDHDESQGRQQYIGEDYFGENALHIAIVNQDIAVAKLLVRDFPELLHQRAIGDTATSAAASTLLRISGSFFKKDAMLPHSLTTTPCYFGELPAQFAASTNQLQIMDLLVAADDSVLNLCDTHGNTILHMCVEHEVAPALLPYQDP